MSLENTFKEIVGSNTNVDIPIDILNSIITNDLKLKIDTLSGPHRTTLPYMLVHFIKKWPGWDKRTDYEKGALDINSWYQRFRQYISYKMVYLITKTLPGVQEDTNSKEKSWHTDASTQLTNRATFANFSIDVAGPASLLSNLMFWGCGDHVTLEEHSERAWVELNNVQLINYPWIEVEFNSPELSFKRSFEPRIYRYISGCADLLYEKPSFIFGKHRINTSNVKFIFQTSVLEQYIASYKETMYPQITTEQQQEVNVILDQFYKDMVDISTNNTVAENRQVTFNIGGNIFKRSKKIFNKRTDDDTSGPNVIFNEVFLPKVISSFRYFTGMQEYNTQGKRVISTNKINTKMMMNFKPMISYKCTYCKLTFSGPEGKKNILGHLESSHKREQPLLCLLCKKSFEITELTEQRWKCTCQDR